MSQGRLVLLCGLPGSGKTTTARRIAAESGGVRFCPDDWMTALGIDLFDQETRGKVEALQWELAQELLVLGQTVIIEWGVWSRSERDVVRERHRRLDGRRRGLLRRHAGRRQTGNQECAEPHLPLHGFGYLRVDEKVYRRAA